MAHAAANIIDREESSEFAALLAGTLNNKSKFTGQVVKGRIVGETADFVIVDVGLKSEGRIPKREFSMPGQDPEIRSGDSVEVFVERMEDRDGFTVLSREKARREEVWVVLEKSCENKERVTGIIYSRVKGGFTVDLGGAVAFLPGSQVDIRPVRDVSPLMGTPQPFMILKMDRQRGNIVVSRRAVLEESREEARSELMGQLREGSIVNGVVKNITDYGAFIDLGGVDGLLHVTDISWKRVNHPSEVLSVGQSIEVQIIRYNEENQRISLGMKQLESDPWLEASQKYTPGMRCTGKITNITDYGAFVELESGIEGLVHVSEMSWTKKNVHPNKIVTPGQEVSVQVLDIDMEKRRISLGIKQTQDNPWSAFAASHQVGQDIEGEIRNITEFGLFVGLSGDIDGMVHLSDVSWDDATEDALKAYKKGDMVKVRILDIDATKERRFKGIELGNDLARIQILQHQTADLGIRRREDRGALDDRDQRQGLTSRRAACRIASERRRVARARSRFRSRDCAIERFIGRRRRVDRHAHRDRVHIRQAAARNRFVRHDPCCGRPVERGVDRRAQRVRGCPGVRHIRTAHHRHPSAELELVIQVIGA